MYSGPCDGAQDLNGSDILLDGTSRTYTVMNLEPNSEYLVQVVATNDAGSSSPVQTIVYTAFDCKYQIMTLYDCLTGHFLAVCSLCYS